MKAMRAPRLAPLAVLSFGAACSSAPQEAAGAGGWDVTHTTLADAHGGRCEPSDLPDGRKGTWCFLMPPLSLDGQNAQVDLYFGGTAPESPLVEIQLKVLQCHLEQAETWTASRFGAAVEHAGDRYFHQNRYVDAAVLPDGGRCLIRILPLAEKAEWERIKKAS
jgi:hypothetical protein